MRFALVLAALTLALPLQAEESDAGAQEAGQSQAATEAPETADDSSTKKGKPKGEAQAASAAALLGPQDGLQLTFSWSVMSSVARESNLGQSFTQLSLGANYKLHSKIFVTGQVGPTLALRAMPSDNRRIDAWPLSSFVRANFRNLYKDELTGIAVGGSATYWLPTSYSDWFTENTRYGEAGLALQLFRNFGKLTVVGSLSSRMPLMASARPPIACDPDKLMPGASCPSYTHTSAFNNLAFLGAGMTGVFNHGPWTIFFAATFQNLYTRGFSSADEPNNTNDSANRRAQFFNFFGANYALGGSLSAAFGYQNWGPQTSNGRDPTNFFFDRRYAMVFAGLDYVR